MIQFGVGVQSLNQLSRDLRAAADKELRKGLRFALKRAAEHVRVRAASNFSWSTRIPATLKVTASDRSAKVKAGGKNAPHAAAFEHHGQEGMFRHPVFARGDRAGWTWVNQSSRPGLVPALRSEADKVLDEVVKGIDEAFRQAGAK